jgi:aspartate ammonia-lyase
MSPETLVSPNLSAATREEKDSLGVRQVPADAYYGVQALRGSENFVMSGLTPKQAYPAVIKAFAWIKKAAAKTNMELGLLDKQDTANNQAVGEALMAACEEMLTGRFDDAFIVDVFQGGTGTSNHMNANEILSNRATELLGGKKGEYRVHPNDHTNYGQSTNDVTPTVMRLTLLAMHPDMMQSIERLEESLRQKATAFAQILIPGRTHMQDAVPLTMGQVFGAYAHAIGETKAQVAQAREKLLEIGLGASALGTGLNTHPQYREMVTRYLAQFSGFALKQTPDYFYATSSFAPFAAYSAALRNLAIEVEKIAQDFKLYSSGPKTGIAELKLPDLQPGSSIMPGKVNPVLPELMNQLSYAVQGNDYTVALCAQNGQWQLNVMMPLTLLRLTESMRLLTNGLRLFADLCVSGVEANTAQCQQRLEHSTILLTALNPYIGYEQAARVAKRVIAENKTVREVVLEDAMTDRNGEVLTPQRLDDILSVEAMTAPRI